MAFLKNVVAFLLLTTLFGVSLGTVYNVGDSKGWIVGNVDYKKWASTKNFRIGDVIVFKYNNKSHDVKQVTHQAFRSCNATSAKATFTTGSDSITLKSVGHQYFLCSFPGHCQAGQKVDIRVAPISHGPSPSPGQTPGSSSPPGSSPMAPAPSKSAAPSLQSFKFLPSLIITFAIFVNAGFPY
ncbi:mavicyanin-like [Mangifera indica]|uniref:mavicyanin-like n=1 Tax=Mangifera indica TaxID=29780 RepID=UPI001CFAAA3E|nr:mavicyanin-like [Mangifera indica]